MRHSLCTTMAMVLGAVENVEEGGRMLATPHDPPATVSLVSYFSPR